jgi:hypothetical protein
MLWGGHRYQNRDNFHRKKKMPSRTIVVVFAVGNWPGSTKLPVVSFTTQEAADKWIKTASKDYTYETDLLELNGD